MLISIRKHAVIVLNLCTLLIIATNGAKSLLRVSSNSVWLCKQGCIHLHLKRRKACKLLPAGKNIPFYFLNAVIFHRVMPSETHIPPEKCVTFSCSQKLKVSLQPHCYQDILAEEQTTQGHPPFHDRNKCINYCNLLLQRVYGSLTCHYFEDGFN